MILQLLLSMSAPNFGLVESRRGSSNSTRRVSNCSVVFWRLGRPVAPFTVSFLGEGSPTKTDYRKKVTLVQTSLLEDLGGSVALLEWFELDTNWKLLSCRLTRNLKTYP